MAKSLKNDLLDDMDLAARELLKSVNPPTISENGLADPPQPIDLKGKVAAFSAVTDYLAVKHKIEPAGATKNGIDRYRSTINGAAGSRARGSRNSAESDSDSASTGES